MAKKLQILIFPDARLRKVADKVTKFDKSLQNLADDMLLTMYDANGIGLAATQVNNHVRLVVMDLSDNRDDPKIFVNPRYKVLKDHNMFEFEESWQASWRWYSNGGYARINMARQASKSVKSCFHIK